MNPTQRNGFVYLVIIVAICAIIVYSWQTEGFRSALPVVTPHPSQTREAPPIVQPTGNTSSPSNLVTNLYSLLDIVVLAIFTLLELFLLFSGTIREQRASRQLKFFCFLTGWNLAYFWPNARVAVHIVLAVIIGVVCYLILKATSVKKTLVSSQDTNWVLFPFAVLIINLLVLVPVLLVLYVMPFSIHSTTQERLWSWNTIFPWFRLGLWVVGGIFILAWSIARLGRTARGIYITSLIVVSACWIIVAYRATLPVVRQVSLDILAEQFASGEVKKVVITGNRLQAQTATGELVASKESDISGLQTLRDLGVSDERLGAVTIEVRETDIWETIRSALPLVGGFTMLALAIVCAAIIIGRANRSFNEQFTSAKSAVEPGGKPPKVTFQDVGGAKEAKEALQDIVQFLKEPETFAALGARMPRGILLEGPPGTGKTLLAQAVAGEAGVPFFYMSGSEFIELFVGVGASRVRNLFGKAKKAAPSLVFIDELDAVGQRREGSLRHNLESSQTLNQLLTELDGFEENTQVVVIAATNRADILDEALTRPGRFDQRIHIDCPSFEEREAILNIHLRGKPLNDNVGNLSEITRHAYDMTGADLATVANRSAILAAKAQSPTIQGSHLEIAMKQVGAVIPDLQPPADIIESMAHLVVGQESVVKALAVAICQHYSDIRTMTDSSSRYMNKPNVLLYGPPGTGKSLIIRTLASQFQVPFASLDASALLENPSNIQAALGRLLKAANNDARRAKYGVICIYGIEDLLSPGFSLAQEESGRMGELLSSGFSHIQEELGRIIEGAIFDVTQSQYSFNSKNVTLDTTHILFFCEGTFSLAISRAHQNVTQAAYGPNRARYEDLIATGFKPRLLDKFSIIAATETLSEDQLLQILTMGEMAPVRQYQCRLAAIGTQVRFEAGAHREIVREAMSRGGGARWLGHILEEILEDYFCATNLGAELVVTGSMVRKTLGGESVVSESDAVLSGLVEEATDAATDMPLAISAKEVSAVVAPQAISPVITSEIANLPVKTAAALDAPANRNIKPDGVAALPQMEITLELQRNNRVVVLCNRQMSHSFDLSDLGTVEQAILAPQSYGEKVYRSLFPPSKLTERGLNSGSKRVLLVTTHTALQEIAWEYAYGPNGFIILEHHFARGLPSDQRITLPMLDGNLHIVAVPANPLERGLSALNIEGEWLRLKEIILAVPNAIHLERSYPPTLEFLRNLVANQHNRIVHFMGHGMQSTQGAVVCFENEYGGLSQVTARDFVQRMKGTVFLVCLNACATARPGPTQFSNLAATLVEQGTPYALGMRLSVADEDALTFSRILYSELAKGSPVEEAVMQARQKLAASPNPWALGVPILYTALDTPALGFSSVPGTPRIEEHRPALDLGAIPPVEGVFQGRIIELQEIGKQLTGDKRPSVVTVHGTGGQGKTALVRAAVERFAHAWPGGVWATSMENLPSREQFSRNLARFLGIADDEQTDLAVVEQRMLARLGQKRTLVVLDNAETLVEAVERRNSAALELAQFIRQQLPAQNASLLVTSRSILDWAGEVTLELGGLDPEAGAELFRQSAPHKIGEDGQQTAGWYNEGRLAMELSEKIEGHPLGLFLLGKAYNASGKPLQEFLQEVETVLLEVKDKYHEDTHRHHSIYACVDASVRCLDENLRNTLKKLWVFHASFLPELVAAVLGSHQLFDNYEFQGILMDIGAPYDLAGDTPSEDTPIYNKMNTDWPFGENAAIYSKLDTLWQRGLLVREVYVTGDRGAPSQVLLYRLLPTIRSYLETISSDQTSGNESLLARFGEAYAVLADTLASDMRSSPAKVHIAEKTLEDLERGLTYATGRPRSNYLLGLSTILERFGDKQKSIDLAQEARKLLEILEKAPEVSQRPRDKERSVDDKLSAMTAVALGYFDSGQLDKALDLLQQVLSVSREYDKRHSEAGALANMGHLYQRSGQPQEALRCFQQALAISQKEKDSQGEADVLNGLGMVHLIGLGQQKRALNFFQKARQALAREASYGQQGDQSLLASILNNLGETYRQMGNLEQATDLFQQAIPILQELEDPLEAVTLYNLARIYQTSGNTLQAMKLFEQALTASQKVNNREVEAAVYVEMSAHQTPNSGEKLLRKAVQIYHDDGKAAFEASSIASLATYLCEHLGKTDEAIELLKHSVKLLEDNNLPQDAGGGSLKQHREFLNRLLSTRKRL